MTQKMATFIQRNRLKGHHKRIESNSRMADMGVGSLHYSFTILKHNGDRMTVPYSVGPSIAAQKDWSGPETADILDCLASDAAGWDNARDFTDWAQEYGYDPDSRNAEKTFRAVKYQSTRLGELLGTEEYETLLYDVERL